MGWLSMTPTQAITLTPDQAVALPLVAAAGGGGLAVVGLVSLGLGRIRLGF